MTRTDGLLIASGAGIAALSALVIQVITARALPLAENAELLAFWSVLLLAYSGATGLQAELVRSGTGAANRRPARRAQSLVLRALMVGLGMSLLVLVSHLQPLRDGWTAGLLVIGALAACGNAGVSASAVVVQKWRTYAGVAAVEPILRFSLVSGVALLGLNYFGFTAAISIAGLAWLGFLVVDPSLGVVSAGVVSWSAVKRILLAVCSAILSAVLVTGLPAILQRTSSSSEFAGAAPLIVAISLTRAPMLLGISAFQPVIVRHLSTGSAETLPRLRRAVEFILYLFAASGLAWLVGPPVIAGFFGAEYRVEGRVLALLVLAAALQLLLSLLGLVLLSRNQHVVMTGAWIIALGCFLIVQMAPLDFAARVVAGLFVAPLAGILVELVGIWKGGVESWKR